MHLCIRHTTLFTYDTPIVEAYTELRLRPLDVDGQHCLSFRTETDPRGLRIREYTDQLGNTVGHFDVLEQHERLRVTTTSEVLTSAYTDRREPSTLELHDYLQPSGYTTADNSIRALAAVTKDGTHTERARQLMHHLHKTLVYERGATTVQTPAADVLDLGRGVCQDFAHLFIAASRSAGIPARYVSGYLYDDALATNGGASHAWVDIFDPDQGWLSLDPTHDRAQDDSYIRIAVGRDYADVPPTRGVFKGTANENLAVEVSVQRLDEKPVQTTSNAPSKRPEGVEGSVRSTV
jgi:transglutaminase-like putative cysteine protease